MATIYRTNGEIIEVEPENGKTFTLQEMYKHTKSDLVEFIYLYGDKKIMVCDEEGKLTGRAVNVIGTLLYAKEYGPVDLIAGDVLVCDNKQIK